MAWFKRGKDNDDTPQQPMPRWLTWILFGFIAYLVIVGNLSTMRDPDEVHPVESAETNSKTKQAVGKEDYPGIRRTFSLSNWQRAFNPMRAEGLKIRDFSKGEGRQAMCGDEVSVTVRGRDADGKPFDPDHDETKPIRFIVGEGSTYPAIEQAVQGMQAGGERIVDAPPILIYDAEESAKQLSTLTLQMKLESLNPGFPKDSAPLLVANMAPENVKELPRAYCGDTIGVTISVWDEKGESISKLPTKELTLGKRQLAIGLDHGLSGIVVGETRTLVIPPGYHLHNGNDSPFAGNAVRIVEVTRVK